jgi:hypothetical protein
MSFPFSVFFATAAVADFTLILPGLDLGAGATGAAAGAFGFGLPKLKSIFKEETCFLAIDGNAENAETWAIKIKAIIVKNSIVLR